MQREVAEHLARAAEQYAARGMTPHEAAAAARRDFGHVEGIKEEARDARGFAAVDDLLRDCRYGVRSLARSPGFALLVVATLAVGVGALTLTFSVVHATLWRQPPFRDAERLGVMVVTRRTPEQGLQRYGWSYPTALAVQEAVAPFARVASFSAATVTVARDNDPGVATGEIVMPEYFAVLGSTAAIGRTFTPTEDGPGRAAPVVVLSDLEWRDRYGGDSAAVGQTMRVNGVPLTIVGVMPPGFRGISDSARVWFPTGMARQLTYADYQVTPQNFIALAARLAPGIDDRQANARLAVVATRLQDILIRGSRDSTATIGAAFIPLNEARVRRLARNAAWTLLASVALLHLLACANVANLLLGRAVARRRETAVRAALGAGAGRLVWQSTAGAAVLASAACALGVGGAAWAIRFVTVPGSLWGRGFVRNVATFSDPAFDGTVLAFGIALGLVTLALVLWAPALGAVRGAVASGLREGARGASADAATLRRPTLRGAIVALEAALAMVLLVGGGLMISSFASMIGTDLGVARDHVLTFDIRPSEGRVPPPAAPAFVGRVVDAIERVPGVEAVTVDGGAPVTGSASNVLYVVGRPQPPFDEAPPILRHYVAPGHFTVLGIPLIRGRVFTRADDARSRPVAVISATAAARFWPDQDPIGQRVYFAPSSGYASPHSAATIVGIVGDAVYTPLDQGSNRADFYTPFTQFTYASRTVLVRTRGDPLAMTAAVRGAVQSVDPDLALVNVQSLEALIGSSWSRQRFSAQFFGGFAILALLLATSGIYAVVAHGVAQRTRELGIRMALGADRATILRLVLKDGMALPAAGLAFGLAGAVALGWLMRALLYRVAPADPVVLAAATGLLAAAAVLACVIPGRRATRVDPMEALRAE